MKSSLYLLLHHFLHQLLISHIRHRDMIAVCMRTVKLLARLHGMRIACPRTATKAVNDVSLDIEQGQFIAILGHNGSGKSTLAKHMNAILNPTEGTLWVDGMDTKDEDNIWKVRQTAGMVFQNPDNQIIGQVVEEDVGFGPENSLPSAPFSIEQIPRNSFS